MTTTLRRRPLLSLWLAAAVTLLSGCGAVTRLTAEDSKASASVRTRWHSEGGDGVDFQGARVRATSTQSIGDFDRVSIGGSQVDGPVSLQHRVVHEHAHLAYSSRSVYRPGFHADWMVGVAAARVDWQTTSAPPTDPPLGSRTSWAGPMGGVGVSYGLNAEWSLEARLTGAVAPAGGARGSSYVFGEAVVAWRPLPRGFVLRAGLSQLGSEVHPRGGATDQVLTVRGPTIDLGLEF